MIPLKQEEESATASRSFYEINITTYHRFFFINAAGTYFIIDSVLSDIRNRYLEAMEESVNDTSGILASLVATDPSGTPDTELLGNILQRAKNRKLEAQIYGLKKNGIELEVYVTDRSGIVVYDSTGKNIGRDYSKWNDVLLTLKGKYGARSTKEDPNDPQTSTMYIASPIYNKSNITGSLTVSKKKHVVDPLIDVAKEKAIRGIPFIAGITILLGVFISFFITYPVRKLTNYIKDISNGFRTPFPELGNTEVKTMGLAFENLREQLEGKRYIESYVQSLTHELKSPLTSIRASCELIIEESRDNQSTKLLHNIYKEASRMNDIIERLLTLARIENKKELSNLELISTDDLLSEVYDIMEPSFKEKSIHLSIQSEKSVPLLCERFLIVHALTNILENARDFSPDHAIITLKILVENQKVFFRVEDEGTGIPEFALDKVFERFYSLSRPDTGRKSSGLGLAFAREAILLHQGEILIKNRTDRSGTICEFFLKAHNSLT